MSKARGKGCNAKVQSRKHGKRGRPANRLTHALQNFTLRSGKRVRNEYLIIKLFRSVTKLLRNIERKRDFEPVESNEVDTGLLQEIRQHYTALRKSAPAPKAVTGRLHFNSYAERKYGGSRRGAVYFCSCSRDFRTSVFRDCPQMLGIITLYLGFVFQKLGDVTADLIMNRELDTSLMRKKLGVQCCTEPSHGEECAEKWRQLRAELEHLFAAK